MVMSVRNVELSNATGAVIATGGASTQIGQDYSGIVVRRTLAAIDVGSTAGKTQHASGMIFAEVYGGNVKGVTSLEVFRIAGGITYKLTYLTDARVYPGFSVTNLNGVSTVRFRDGGAGNGLLVAGDIVVMVLEVGNS